MMMPPEIGYWTSLTELSVASNRLTALPIELGLLTILSRLDIAHNEITVPPAEVRAIPALMLAAPFPSLVCPTLLTIFHAFAR
jgi:Leucine-rich repeat (LRR) protein